MTFTEESEIRAIERRLVQLERLAFAIVLTESLTRAVWRPATWIALFAGLWLVEIPSLFGSAGEIAALACFLTGLGWLILRDSRSFRLPDRDTIRRRIEIDSGLPHRPLSTLEDTLANSRNAVARKLWERRGQWLAGLVNEVRVPATRPVLSKLDPYALRYLASLILVFGIFVAGPLWKERLARGLVPVRIPASEPSVGSPVVFRITPPDYTGLPEVVVENSEKASEPLTIPEGSRVKVTVSGGWGTPLLSAGGQDFPMKEVAPDTYTLEAPVLPGDEMTVRQFFFPRARLRYVYAGDQPPRLAEAGKIEITPEGALAFPVELFDDYGVKDLVLEMNLDPVVEESPLGDPVLDRRLVMSPAGETAETRPVYDLTGHTWAGLPVVLTLTAVDGTGQSSKPLVYKTTLPERPFRHPVSNLLIEMRRQIAWMPLYNAQQVAIGLRELQYQPETFDGDLVVYLGLGTAAARLSYSPGEESARAVIPLLWELALRLDDGGLTLAMKNLRDAQKDLEEALRDPQASEEDLAAKMDKLQNALAEYFQELAREMEKRMAEGAPMPMLPPEAMNQVIDPQSLNAFLNQMRAEALSGDKNAAQEMLSRIQRMMDMLDPSRMAELPPDMQFMNESQNELQELVEKQQLLLDQTREKALPQQDYGEWLSPGAPLHGPIEPGKLPPAPIPAPGIQKDDLDMQASHADQEALRFVLGQLMREAGEILGDIPEGMAAAELEMRESSSALSEGNPSGSIPHQEAAIENLQQAMDDVSQQMAARMQQMVGLSFGGSANGVDPLGRPVNPDGQGRDFFGSNVKIPDERERERLDEILRTLRQRSGDLSRPEMELDYFRRLLRQF